MDTADIALQEAIVKVLDDYIEFLGDDPDTVIQRVIDRDNDRYLSIELGWQGDRRIYGNFIPIDIIDDKIWIQHDGTEEGIADELVKLGIPHQKIVLAYKSPDRRKITDFAVF